MPKTVNLTTAQALFSIPLPNHGGAYTVVSHKFIVEEVLAQLQANNLKVVDEVYKTNLNGEIAQGTYVLEYGADPELSLMFAWVNSYDKSMRFKCGVGASISMGNGCMFAGDISNYGRKHIYNAQQEVKDHIADQLTKAASFYKQLCDNKNAMKSIYMNAEEAGSFLGRLFFTHDVITSSQLINIKASTRKTLNSGNIKLWSLYTTICDTLRSSHPKTWMEQQKGLHAEVSKVYLTPFYEALAESQKDPAQTNLLDQIEEIENKTISFNPGEIVEKLPLNAPEEYDEDMTDFEAGSLDEPSMLSLDDYLTETTNEKQDDNNLEEQTSDDKEEVTEEQNTYLESSSEFPVPPADIPVFIPDVEGEKTESVVVGQYTVPLHEQVAFEEVVPVTEEEKQISSAPIVNKEDEVVFVEPSYASDFDFEKLSGSSTAPDFEF